MKKTAPTGESLGRTSLSIHRPTTVYHGTEKIQKWVRRGNLWIGGLIMTCAMILSYSHTANLFRWAFYDGWLAHVGVIMVELTFFLGAMNIILAKSAGLLAGWPARVAFMFGALLVGWSNVSSGKMFLSQEETAIALGLAIPICLFLMEAIVSRALFLFRTARRMDLPDNQTNDILNKRTTDNLTDTPDSKMAGQSNTSNNQSDRQTTETNKTPENRHTKKATKQTSTRQTNIPEVSNARQSDNQTAPKPDSQTNRTPDNQTAIRQKASEQKSKQQKPDTTEQSNGQSNGQPNIHKVIREMIATGEQLSVRNVARKANTSNYQAHKALKEWREKGKIAN